MKDVFISLRRNFVQPIVIAILLLAAALLVLGEYRDAWFVSFVIVFNTLFAIVQELRAQRALKKLELLSAPRARRINDDGTVSDVLYNELAAGDTIDVRMGDELPADGVIISSRGLEVNESMLTGESVSILKEAEATVYAASTIVAGSAFVRVVAVGADTRVGDMTRRLQRYIPTLTPLQRAIARTITVMTYGALALALLIFVVYYVSGQDAVKIVKTITSAAVTVVPEGLLLASTLLLAFGSLRLSQAKVLPQKLAAIEAMALVSLLAVDKTGTLTSDDIQFSELVLFDKAPAHTAELIAATALETSSGNATGDAMIAGLPDPGVYDVRERLAFSSSRKYSGARIVRNGSIATILIGAPEFLAPFVTLSRRQKKQLQQAASQGNRVLLAVQFTDETTPLRDLKKASGTPLGMLLLSNELRKGVVKTVQFLQDNQVSLRVISGDNPDTVRYIAERAGIAGADKVVTGAELATLSPSSWQKAARDYTIFARVLPEQKERLIGLFQEAGEYTGMVGDGVNDALALKKSDLGVAMFAGAAATRRIADIVLLNNSFNALPLGMKLGNRIMQSIEMIATLFFHKIIYGIILLLVTIFLGITYPFEPRHNTFMNVFLVTLPTLMLTLVPPLPRHRLSPKRFWRDTLLAVAPIAVISGATVALSYYHMLRFHPDDSAGVATTTVLIASFFGVYLVFLVGKMFHVTNTRPAKLARILYILAVLFMVTISFGIGFMRDFFDFTTPAWQDVWPVGLLVIVAAVTQWLIAVKAGQRVRRATTNEL